MSFLPNAHDFQINGGEFVNVENHHHHHSGQSGIDILLEASAPDAAVDSEARGYAPSCFPGTRKQYIADITEWVTAPDDGSTSQIYWLKGPAGVGKSAIAQSCAEKLQSTGRLGAAFFFSINGRQDYTKLFTSIAYQLSTVLPDYRAILERKISKDKTLVKKKMSSQFKFLIIEPLQELEKRDRGVQRRAIFIDGLDECKSEDAQVEIIDLIAASVREGSTPFCWAIFSRPEPGIAAAFSSETVAPLSSCVELSISRDIDGDIEVYLRAEFKNMLRRRKLCDLSSSWPTDKDIELLVEASSGLFAYPAAVLRFIDKYPSLSLQDTLRGVLDSITKYDSRLRSSPFAELDALYIHILPHIPKDIFSVVQLFLAQMVMYAYDLQASVSVRCNGLGLSESEFRSICNHLHAVVAFQEPSPPRLLARSYLDQGSSTQFHPLPVADRWYSQSAHSDCSSSCESPDHLSVFGHVIFRHKSFHDFLGDHGRSSSFCVATLATRVKLYHHLIQRHDHYAKSYAVQDGRLVLAAGMPNSSVSLSWPRESENVDSLIKFHTFCCLAMLPPLALPMFAGYIVNDYPSYSQKLAMLDFRKGIIARIMLARGSLVWKLYFYAVPGYERATHVSLYQCIRPDCVAAFDLRRFLEEVKVLEKAGVIKSYHPHLPSTVTSAFHIFSPQKSKRRGSGLFKVGHGEKSVIWYWEFDLKEGYFHDFLTVNFVEAMKLYKTEKFAMWKRDWQPPSL